MHKLIFIIITLVFYGCSQKISEHFKQNKYLPNFNIHIINDSLQLYFKSPADIVYTTGKKDLKKVIRKAQFELKDSVLVYGITDDPPYECFITVSKNGKQDYSNDLIVFDTLINGLTLQFIGHSLVEDSKRILRIDLENMFNSLIVGPDYRKKISADAD